MSKTAPKQAAATKPAAKKAAPVKAKPAAKPAAKSGAKAPPKPAAKSAAKPAAKAAKTPPAKAAPKPAAAPKSVTKTPAPAAKKAAPAKPEPKPAAKPAAKAPAAPAPKPEAKAKAAPVAAKPAPAKTAPKSGGTSNVVELRPGADTAVAVRPPQRPAPRPYIEPVRPVVKIDPKLANVWKTKAGRDLSDDEVLAMPDGEYMNDKQLEFFRTRLEGLKNDLLSNAGETTEHLREDTSIVPDPADRATIEEEHALELRTRDRERKLLKKISQSLARIEAGDYGYCDETGEPIGLARLLARPTATLSLEAQQRRELKQKMFGD